MFICEITGRVTKSGEKMNRIPIVKRNKVYFKKLKSEDTGKWGEVEVGRGWEIVKEISVSEEGLAIWQAMSDQQKENLVRKLHSTTISI